MGQAKNNMSHPVTTYDPNDRHHSDDSKFSPSTKGKKKSAKSKALKGMIHPISKTIEQLKERKGEAPLHKLKRLLK